MLTGPSIIPDSTKRALILFHGYGSNGEDLISLAPLFQKAFPDMAVFAPNAPTATFFDGYEWFPLNDLVNPNLVTKTYLDDLVGRAGQVYPEISDYVNDLCNTHGLTTDKIILAGFSQGGLMAQYAALKSETPFQAIIGMSSVPLVFGKSFPMCDVKHHMPILLTHGHNDEVIPIQSLSLSTEELSAAKQYVTSFSTPGLGHGVNDICINHIIDFIKRLD